MTNTPLFYMGVSLRTILERGWFGGSWLSCLIHTPDSSWPQADCKFPLYIGSAVIFISFLVTMATLLARPSILREVWDTFWISCCCNASWQQAISSWMLKSERYITGMLFAGWEVCIVKNCDPGLENAAWGRKITYLFFSKLSNEKKLTGKKLFKCYCDHGQR